MSKILILTIGEKMISFDEKYLKTLSREELIEILKEINIFIDCKIFNEDNFIENYYETNEDLIKQILGDEEFYQRQKEREEENKLNSQLTVNDLIEMLKGYNGEELIFYENQAGVFELIKGEVKKENGKVIFETYY